MSTRQRLAFAVGVGCVAIAASAAHAELKLGPLIGDHMVVQHGRPVRLAGTAAPGERVTATLGAASATAAADAAGRWSLALPALAPGGPFSLAIAGAGGRLVLSDVWAGEVWIAAGQSNMEIPLQRSRGGADAAATGCSGMRLYTIAHATGAAPAASVGGEWQPCDEATAAGFSAVAFHFGRELHRTLGVPVGLVQVSVGGAPAEAFTPRAALAGELVGKPMLAAFDAAIADPSLRAELARKLADWEAKTFHQDRDNRGEKLGYARDSGGAGWAPMQIPRFWEAAGLAIDGAVWFRREVTVPDAWAGSDLALSLGAIDDYDVTYWNGERVGATGNDTPQYWAAPRRYVVPGRLVRAGRNVLAVRVFDHFGSGGFGGSAVQMYARPVAAPGAAAAAALPLAGAWTYKVERRLKPAVVDWATRPRNFGSDDAASPTVLWNGMVAPLTGVPIAGVVWYQGENNIGRAAQYAAMFPAMIRGWRVAWGAPRLPFLFVQLPNFGDPAAKATLGDSTLADMREAQAAGLREPATAMAVTIDIGDAKEVHPQEKQEVGRRLALGALRVAYGKDVIASGPTFAAAAREGGALRVRFASVASGLTTADGAPPKGFLIAGADRVWHAADARIDGGSVIVSSAAVPSPVAVRYAWANNPPATLRSQADLPAAPFRTDDWPAAPVTATAR